MEQEQVTTVSTRDAGIRYGLIGALVGIVMFVGLTMAGVPMQSPINYLRWIVPIVLIILAHNYYKENGNGFMSYGQGIGIALWYGLVSSAISAVFTFIYIKFIDSTFLEAARDVQMEEMAKRGMSDEQIEQAMKFAGAFMSPGAITLFALIGGIIGAIIIGLIVTIFTKKESPQTAI